METTQEKPSLIRHIIIKLFCQHQYREIYKIETKDSKDNVVGLSAARECSICGRTKKVTL